jgi:hypothetical protein
MTVNEEKLEEAVPGDRVGQSDQSGIPIRFRAVIVGLILAVIICAITPFNNTYRQGTPLGGGHFPLAPFFILFWMTLLIAFIGHVFKGRSLLSAKELLFTWILTVLGSGIAYTGLVRTFFLNLTVPYHFATVGNRWEEVIQPLLPQAWYPQSRDAIAALYNGLDGGRTMSWMEVLQNIPWGAWLSPLLLWSGFILLSYFVMICMVNLLSRQWIMNERMNFPLLQVPLLMEEAAGEGTFFKFLSNQYFLTGLAIPVLLHTINGLNFYEPSVPQLPTLIPAGVYFPKFGLFSAFHNLTIYIYPAFIGFAFLASRQISFSMWAFFLLGGLVIGLLSVLGYNIPAAALGVTFGPHLTRPEETQMLGAYGVFFVFILWLSRHHIWSIIRQSLGLAPTNRSDTEWFSIRIAFWGVTLGGMGIIFWLNYFGLPLLQSFLLVGAFFMVMLVASRVICQGGLAYFTLTAAPMDGLLAFFGPGFFTNVGLVVSAVVQKVLYVDLRESLMPSLFHAGKVSQPMRNKRMVISGVVITLLLAVFVSFLAMMALCYKYGIRELQLDWATRTSLTVVENVRTLVETPTQPGHWVQAFTIAGAVFMLLLVICYHRFYWWPIHPIGYLVAYSTAMQVLWFSFFVGWMANALCMRYGGVALFRKLRLLFVGLIIGDFLMGGIWALIGLLADASYQVLPS